MFEWDFLQPKKKNWFLSTCDCIAKLAESTKVFVKPEQLTQIIKDLVSRYFFLLWVITFIYQAKYKYNIRSPKLYHAHIVIKYVFVSLAILEINICQEKSYKLWQNSNCNQIVYTTNLTQMHSISSFCQVLHGMFKIYLLYLHDSHDIHCISMLFVVF